MDGYHNRLQNFYHNKRNYVILEMVNDKSNIDKYFVDQINEAKPETKEFMNSLIGTLEHKKRFNDDLEIDEMSTLDRHVQKPDSNKGSSDSEDQMEIRKKVI